VSLFQALNDSISENPVVVPMVSALTPLSSFTMKEKAYEVFGFRSVTLIDPVGPAGKLA
jgi:hypothetical protein